MEVSESDIGCQCPRCNSVVRKAMSSTIKDGMRLRYCQCRQCGKQFYTVEVRRDVFEALLLQTEGEKKSSNLN